MPTVARPLSREIGHRSRLGRRPGTGEGCGVLQADVEGVDGRREQARTSSLADHPACGQFSRHPTRCMDLLGNSEHNGPSSFITAFPEAAASPVNGRSPRLSHLEALYRRAAGCATGVQPGDSSFAVPRQLEACRARPRSHFRWRSDLHCGCPGPVQRHPGGHCSGRTGVYPFQASISELYQEKKESSTQNLSMPRDVWYSDDSQAVQRRPRHTIHVLSPARKHMKPRRDRRAH